MSSLVTVPLFESCMYMLAIFGVYILFSILKFADISTDNVFAFGSISGAFVFLSTNSLFLTVISVFLLGFLIGSFTSFLYSVIKIPKLLAGIITYSILFSINIKFFRKPNISFDSNLINSEIVPYLIIGLDILFFLFIVFLFKTKLGKSLTTAGTNPNLLLEFGAPYKLILIIGVGFCNSLIATSGFLTSIYFGFSDFNIGVGILVNSVAAIIISERLMSYFNKLYRFLVVFGGIVLYNFLLYFIISYLSFGFLDFSDYKLISGLIIILFFVFNRKQLNDVMSL